MIAPAAEIVAEHVDLESPTLPDHILAAARRVAVRDGLAGLTSKAVACEAGMKKTAIGLIGPIIDHLVDYVFAALVAAHADIRDQPRPNRWRAYGMIEELFAGEPDLAALVMIACALAVPTGASSGAATAAGRFRQMRRATELALMEDVANDHHFAETPDAARSYAAETIADYIEIAARIWVTDDRNPAPHPMPPVAQPLDDAEPTATPSESEPGSGHILIDELRAARCSAGWSRATLGERVGVDAQTIKRIEQGRGSVKTLVEVMTALNFRLAGLGKGKTLAEQLREKRNKQSPANLAKKAGISPATIVALERGKGTVASLLSLLAVLAPQVRRRAPERAYWGQGDKDDRDSRFTSLAFMSNINAAFGEVDIDPCGHESSPVIAHRRILFAQGGDGLTEDWSGRLAYVNPPYSAAARWLRRAHEQWIAGNVQTVVCLVPVRTDSGLFHDVLSKVADFYLLRGRPKFTDLSGKAQHTPFSIMVVMLGATADQKRRYAELVPGFWMTGGVAADETILP
jgi:DNA-binding XRE family transcriptional regulator